MSAYYNEIDPFAAQWLRNLIAAKFIARGEVDERSIVDVRSDDLKGFTQCHFFAGIGGWSYALRLAGWPDDRPVWTGSCPCQPFSAAGKQKGFADERHLWPVFRNLIEIGRPTTVFGEQVASATAWLGLVRSDLEALGYAVGAMPIEAASAGADHKRDRYWFVGDTDEPGSQGRQLLPERAGQRSARPSGLEHTESVGRCEGRPEHEVRSGRDAATSASSSIGLAYTDFTRESEGREQRSGQQRGASGDTEALHSVCEQGSCCFNPNKCDGNKCWLARNPDAAPTPEQWEIEDAEADRCLGNADGERRDGQHALLQREEPGRLAQDIPETTRTGSIEWVIGADGKARRVKSGIRLLAHGVPDRVAKLRAYGNAIDPRPAAEFIGAVMECIP